MDRFIEHPMLLEAPAAVAEPSKRTGHPDIFEIFLSLINSWCFLPNRGVRFAINS
jgi:hypothetical protein